MKGLQVAARDRVIRSLCLAWRQAIVGVRQIACDSTLGEEPRLHAGRDIATSLSDGSYWASCAQGAFQFNPDLDLDPKAGELDALVGTTVPTGDKFGSLVFLEATRDFYGEVFLDYCSGITLRMRSSSVQARA